MSPTSLNGNHVAQRKTVDTFDLSLAALCLYDQSLVAGAAVVVHDMMVVAVKVVVVVVAVLVMVVMVAVVALVSMVVVVVLVAMVAASQRGDHRDRGEQRRVETRVHPIVVKVSDCKQYPHDHILRS